MIADEAGLDGRAVAGSGQAAQPVLNLLRAAAQAPSQGQRARLASRAKAALKKLNPAEHEALFAQVTARLAELTGATPSVNPETGLQEFAGGLNKEPPLPGRKPDPNISDSASVWTQSNPTVQPPPSGIETMAAFAPNELKPMTLQHQMEPIYYPVSSGTVRQQDRHGAGHFGASRGGRPHEGLDIVAQPGDPVVSPIDGTVSKLGYPYEEDPSYRYVEVTSPSGYISRVHYVDPGSLKVGADVKGGISTIGTVQDLAPLYPGITGHVHMEVANPRIHANPSGNQEYKKYLKLDPTNLLQHPTPTRST